MARVEFSLEITADEAKGPYDDGSNTTYETLPDPIISCPADDLVMTHKQSGQIVNKKIRAGDLLVNDEIVCEGCIRKIKTKSTF